MIKTFCTLSVSRFFIWIPTKMNGMKGLMVFVLLLNCFNGIYSVSRLLQFIKYQNFNLCLSINSSRIFKNLTVEEILEITTAFRAACQTQTGVSDDLVDGINSGEFPRDRALMVKTKCSFRHLEKFVQINK